MNEQDFLNNAIEAHDSSATIYWLFEMLFISVKQRLIESGCQTSSHFETRTVGLDFLLKHYVITEKEADLYMKLWNMYILSEYANLQYAWEEVSCIISPVEMVCNRLRIEKKISNRLDQVTSI